MSGANPVLIQARHGECNCQSAMENQMSERIDRRRFTQAALEAAQDAFVVALKRMRALEEIAARMRKPLGLGQADDLWTRLAALPRLTIAHAKANGQAPTIDDELRAAREVFAQVREALRIAEAEAALAA